MVLMSVDFPSPVWPALHQYEWRQQLEARLTNADDVELETALQQLALNLRGDAVEPDVASGEDSIGLLGHGVGGGHFRLSERRSG